MVFPGNNQTLSILIIVSLFWSLASPARNPVFQNKKIMNVLYFGDCDSKEYPLSFVKWSFVRNRSQTIISGEEIVSRDTTNPMTIYYRIEKCKDKSNPDTCEYYNTWKWDDLCAIMNVLPFVSKIRSLHNPPLYCPFKKTRRALSVEYFENCDNKVYPIMYLRWSFTRNGSQTIINGEEVVSKDITEPMTTLYKIHKCRDKSNVDTCEYYNTWKWENTCTVIRLVPFLKNYLDLHTPPLACPFKKGHYYLRDAKFDAYAITELLSSGSAKQLMWKFRAMVLERNHTTACVDFALRVANIRVKL